MKTMELRRITFLMLATLCSAFCSSNEQETVAEKSKKAAPIISETDRNNITRTILELYELVDALIEWSLLNHEQFFSVYYDIKMPVTVKCEENNPGNHPESSASMMKVCGRPHHSGCRTYGERHRPSVHRQRDYGNRTDYGAKSRYPSGHQRASQAL